MVFGIDVVLLQEEEVEVQGDSLGEDKVHVITSIGFPSFSLSIMILPSSDLSLSSFISSLAFLFLPPSGVD